MTIIILILINKNNNNDNNNNHHEISNNKVKITLISIEKDEKFIINYSNMQL
jgi:hypothetical protein